MRWQVTWLVMALAPACDRARVGDGPAPPPTAATVTGSAAALADPAPAPEASGGDAGPDAGPSDTRAETDPGGWLTATLESSDPRWKDWLRDAERLRLQILVTRAASANEPWVTHSLRLDAEYFYPASAIKTFVAIAALRSASERAGGDIDLATQIRRCRSDRGGCEPPPADEEPGSGNADGTKKKHRKLRFGEEIQKMLSYSDNDSYNRLYDLIGHRELSLAMASMGFPAARLQHRMSEPELDVKDTPRVLLLPPGKPIIDIPRRKSDLDLAPVSVRGLEVGQGYVDAGKQVDRPMSFADKNYASLADLQRLNVSLLFPERPGAAALGLSTSQRELVVRALTAKLGAGKLARDHHPMAPGVLEVLPRERVRYVGKSGRAYGFHIENAYIEDLETRRGFFVTVAVYANPDGILNDDNYGYEEISRPLLRALGEALARAALAPAP